MKEYVRTIADYPVKGIQFRDITTLLQNAGHFKQVIDDMVKPWQNKKIDAVLSIESLVSKSNFFNVSLSLRFKKSSIRNLNSRSGVL